MDGRDIGTVVLPNADLKIYVIADPRIRAQRRFLELEEKAGKGNMNLTLEEIHAELLRRDTADLSREHGPLRKAEGAIEIDTSVKTPEEVIEIILSELKKKT